jgi:hypothetical protein
MAWNLQSQPNVDGWGNNREIQTWESSKIYGRPIYYLKASQIKQDQIFGESVSRKFLEANAHPFYAFRNDDTFFGGSEQFNQFGFLPSYNDLINLPVKWCKDAGFEPIEDDLIYFVDTDMLFQISKVMPLTESASGDYINGRLFVYKIYLKLYSLADDTFETTSLPTLEDLDDVLDEDLNEPIKQTISDLDVIVPASPDNPFGELG